MNWNKDEAVKAKGFAEKKMESKDFVEAKKFALKAQRLCSDLDGIPQMLTVIEVHSSAAQKVFGTEMDWYGILQLGLTADDSLVKKQYRKLALLLHPDKNKMAGAEAAFKIIGDAHRVLSDRESRAKYDDRYKAFKQWQSSNLPSQTESVSLHQNQPGLTKPTFWTLCPFCSTKYQYYKDILNKHLRCQNCSKPFLAYDVNAQGLPSEANWTWQGGTQAQKASQDGRNLGPQNTGSVLFPNKGNCSHVTAGSSIKRSGTSSSYSEPKNKAGVCENVKEAAQGESQNMPKHNVGKSSRKAEVDSREKCDTESSNSVEELDTPEREKYFGTSGGNYRSSAKKRRVTYNEDKDSKNEFAEPLKDNKSSTVVEDQTNGGALKTTKPDDLAAGVVEINTSKKQKKGDPFEENLRNGYAKTDPGVKKGESAAAGEDSNEKLKSDDISESDSIEDRTLPEPVFIDVPDTEFYLFDNDKKEDCFHKDQLWAIYDYMDSMPRFYAWIKEVHSPGFKVRITWLEPNPDDQAEIDWVAEDLPVSCGKFKFQKTETTQDINMFSHVVLSAKIIQRGVFFICPAKGETWALFKKWNINWNSDPDNHRDSEFDYVEIVSDYGEESGITVAYLGKVKGFVSLFRRKKKVALYGIPANELYRFSHMVPRYRTTGKERTGVPAGCFELDPAALPTNPVDLKDI